MQEETKQEPFDEIPPKVYSSRFQKYYQTHKEEIKEKQKCKVGKVLCDRCLNTVTARTCGLKYHQTRDICIRKYNKLQEYNKILDDIKQAEIKGELSEKEINNMRNEAILKLTQINKKNK